MYLKLFVLLYADDTVLLAETADDNGIVKNVTRLEVLITECSRVALN